MTRASIPAASLILFLFASPAALAESVRPQVVSVLTATTDVHDIAVVGERTLLATSGGLVVLEGEEVLETLTTGDGLPGARLRALSVVPGGVWVCAVEGAALLRLDGAGSTTIVRTAELPRVQAVARFAGATWLATYGRGLFRLADGAEATPEPITVGGHATHRQQTSLALSGGELLVGTAGAGIFRLASDGSVLGRVRQSRGLADDLVWDLVADGDDVLAATASGLSLIRDGAIVPQSHPSLVAERLPVQDVRSVVPVADELWVATFGGGVHRIRPGRANPRQVGDEGLRRSRALAVSGARVLVGHAEGLHSAASTGASLRAVRLGGLPSGDVTSLARAFGRVWVGTFTHGLAQVVDGRARWVRLATERWRVDRRVNHLAVTRAGTTSELLWVATDRGLFWHDGRRFVRVEERNAPAAEEHVTSLHVHPSTGELWVTSSRQLSRLAADGSWQSWTGDEHLPIANLHAVTSDSGGTIWVGSLHGLFRFDAEAGRFHRHSVSSGDLPVDWVTALHPWGDGIVAGTYHGGLSWYDGSSFRIERERSGLPSGWVNPHAMTRLGGSLWFGSLERGLVVGRQGSWHHLTTDDGLPSNDVTAILGAGEGSAWVATRGGLARVRW